MRYRLIGVPLVLSVLLAVGGPARAYPPPHLGYGMMLASPPDHLHLVRQAGFDWFKYFAYWDMLDGDRNRVYDWRTVDWRLDEACAWGLNLLLRVERHPDNWTPIQEREMDAWQAFFGDLAAYVAQRSAACQTPYRVALEIWNEPNLDFQWGHQPVDPVRYTRMVQRAYLGAKAADPYSIIVAGGLAPTGGTDDNRAMNDVTFLEAMYAAGLKGHFDAISTHNYGFGGPPEDKTYGWGILNFRRAEDIYAVMVAHGDGDKPVWGTEFGWLLESAACNAYWHNIGFAWQQVTAAQQADYLQRAFAYADENWPWMEVLVVSNLDFSVMPWYGECDPLRYFAVLEQDAAPRPAYTTLAQMLKRPRSWAIWGMQVSPPAMAWMMTPSTTRVVSQEVTVHNLGDAGFGWTVTAGPGSLPVTLTPASGLAGESFVVEVDARGLGLGNYSRMITLTADRAEIPQSPMQLPVHLHVVETIYRTHLPQVLRGR